MITVWNRKELFCTFDMKKQAEVRDILWKFDISYEMRVSDRADFFVSGRTTSTDAQSRYRPSDGIPDLCQEGRL